MTYRTAAVAAGLERGWIEFRQTMTSVGDVLGWVWPSIIALIVMYALSDSTVPGTSFSLGSQAIPGILGMNVVLVALMGLASALTMERRDGTLLRAKATPNGVLGYLTGKVISQAGMAVAILVLVLIPAAFLFDGLDLYSVSSWLTLVWVLALGLAATLPIGAVLGSLLNGTQSLGFVMLLFTGLVAISGVFYPITALPEWLQWIGQAFPIYWLGLGMRAALLPDVMAGAEIGGSWRHLETTAVLGAWAVIGFAVAPVVLRRMARRESGSKVAR
ncbi:ABC transporter permease [Planosporangium mesophilum]|nr:ABC transporter permease [Planosporangium mesophilum]